MVLVAAGICRTLAQESHGCARNILTTLIMCDVLLCVPRRDRRHDRRAAHAYARRFRFLKQNFVFKTRPSSTSSIL